MPARGKDDGGAGVNRTEKGAGEHAGASPLSPRGFRAFSRHLAKDISIVHTETTPGYATHSKIF
jgi:hypothetical protein